ncbi:RNA polymerase II subunit A C-terminal domain phosphatase SSU72 [Zancudomyces culisetae]|uniref:RNA polymerase II subunit A C-terminal domain phosphatase SSU72 n=1 Tax=Zancudomyces culisetae TaxID=1213189 RepID=A0A1R1PEK1_ZANCU|nr:RNA polymerase II subunit A C-terminal domain phosphatase SSU72 [Zancudomyces culisetae]OMH82681.1 RNA polymerase II subunit A C-terminal domain phosphatase SSU72 [Zancudomyces culisetae]|eukprot:OMH79386.1 RNA polymerase II subunit A C-terminal domain phosphatase SSU72 [Zancudomyces culisetae]
MVRLPGESIDRPNVYEFGTPYLKIYEDLSKKNPSLYVKNGLLKMLQRNIDLKLAPQKFQLSQQKFDVVITCEERCFDAVCEELLLRQGRSSQPVHVINVEIKDNHVDATKGGGTIEKLVKLISDSKDLDTEIWDILDTVQSQCQHRLLYAFMYY